MTDKEAKAAFRDKVAVVYNGIEYLRITALICRHDEKTDGYKMQLELLDKCKHAVVIAAPNKVAFV